LFYLRSQTKFKICAIFLLIIRFLSIKMEIEDERLLEGGSGIKLTDYQLGYIKGRLDARDTVKRVAKYMKISKNTIYNLKKNGFKYPEKNKREPLFSEQEKEAMIEAVDQNRNLTAAQVYRDP
jgi:hypothetical protein